MTLHIRSINLRTVDHKPHGQSLVVTAHLEDGREVELIREFGALPDVVIDHIVTAIGSLDIPAAQLVGANGERVTLFAGSPP